MPNQEHPKKGRIVYSEALDEGRVLYANVITVNHTPWDFALHFYNLVVPVHTEKAEEPVDLTAKKTAVVSIPVTLVRGLIGALQTNLERYEQSYGKVEIPKPTEGEESA